MRSSSRRNAILSLNLQLANWDAGVAIVGDDIHLPFLFYQLVWVCRLGQARPGLVDGLVQRQPRHGWAASN